MLFPQVSYKNIFLLTVFQQTDKFVCTIANQHAATMKGEKRTDTMVQFQHHEPTALTREDNKPWGPKEYHYQNHPLHLIVIV